MKIEAWKFNVLKIVVSPTLSTSQITQQQQNITTAINKGMVSSAGSSCFLPLLFVSLCLPSVVSPPSPFLAIGSRVWTTKIVVFLMCFFWHLFCPSFSLTAVCRLGDETTEVKRPREKRWAFGAENYVRCFWLLGSLFLPFSGRIFILLNRYLFVVIGQQSFEVLDWLFIVWINLF